ncbi:MAG: DNA polymerase III subunit delta [Spongiibacteraceae bacterium]
MRLRPEKLAGHLKQGLANCYLISGDELLLNQECCDEIRTACREQGVTEREILEVDRYFNWQQLHDVGQSMSLFAERKLIELRLGSAKMDAKSSAALQEYLNAADGSNILLLNCGRLDNRSLNSKWVKAIDAAGVVMQVWPIERRQLGQWIMQRMRARGMSADQNAVELLADRVEGNLLAANQEIEKLRILVGDKNISSDTVASAVASSARYDIFKLIDAALTGNAAYALKMLGGLIAEGGEEIAMLGALSRELRNLYQCAYAIEQGQGTERVLDNARVWDKRKPLYKACLNRLSSRKIGELLQLASRIDAAQKGQSAERPQPLLSNLVSTLAGQPLLQAS